MTMHVHWFRIVAVHGANAYEQCRCGERRAQPIRQGYSPIDRGWLATGQWTPAPTVAPRKP